MYEFYYEDNSCTIETTKENVLQGGTFFVKVKVEQTDNYTTLEKVYEIEMEAD